MGPAPAAGVIEWLNARPAASLYTTSITQAEILHGILLLPAGKRRRAFADAATAMFAEDFVGRIIAFGTDAARFYAEIAAGRRLKGRPISHFDAQIAAIARSTAATLATRNTLDYLDCGIEVTNPWD